MQKMKGYLLIALIALTAISCIKPIYPKEQILQHIGTLLIVFILIWDIKNRVLTNIAFLGITLFGIIHILGARYIYSYVPYQDFLIQNFDLDINAYFGWERNHYDRLVHFSFGFFILPSLYELIDANITVKKGLIILIAWISLQSFSMIYELIEWMLTIIMSSVDAENYNGQQGDIWDAQKDMALAMLGSSIMGVVYYLKD